MCGVQVCAVFMWVCSRVIILPIIVQDLLVDLAKHMENMEKMIGKMISILKDQSVA